MSIECCSCGARTEVEQSFHKARRSFSHQKVYYCPLCWAKWHQRFALFQLLLWVVLCLVGIGMVVFASEGSEESTIGWVELNLVLGYLLLLIQILPHELGHAAAAYLLGWRVFKIALGQGKNLYRLRCGNIFVEINAIPTIGITQAGSASAKLYRLKKFLFVLAGPLTNAVLLTAILFLVPGSQLLAPLPGTKLFLWLALLGSCIVLLIGNLIPFQTKAVIGPAITLIDSDGLALSTALFLSSATIRKQQATYFLLEGFYSYLRDDDEAAKRWYEQGLEFSPEDPLNRIGLAMALLFLKEFQASRVQWLRVLEQELPPAVRVSIEDNLAWTDMVIGGAEHLAEADRLSQETVQEQPWNPVFLGTRGSVLIELGQAEKGLPLVRRAFAAQDDPRVKALHACYLALGECQRGNRAEGQRQRDLAEKLDARCFLLDRVDQALGTVVVRG